MSSKLVTIDNFSDISKAHISKGKLDSEGIKCFLEDEKIIGDTQYSVAFGGIKLKVTEEDAERARKILKEG